MCIKLKLITLKFDTLLLRLPKSFTATFSLFITFELRVGPGAKGGFY